MHLWTEGKNSHIFRLFRNFWRSVSRGTRPDPYVSSVPFVYVLRTSVARVFLFYSRTGFRNMTLTSVHLPCSLPLFVQSFPPTDGSLLVFLLNLYCPDLFLCRNILSYLFFIQSICSLYLHQWLNTSDSSTVPCKSYLNDSRIMYRPWQDPRSPCSHLFCLILHTSFVVPFQSERTTVRFRSLCLTLHSWRLLFLGAKRT